MTSDEKNKRKGIEELFDEAEIISVYTDQQAVEDGVLFNVQGLAKISPGINLHEGPFQHGVVFDILGQTMNSSRK